jgi:arginyl-tRNA synthetase
VSLGALKYFILKVDPKKKMLFDPKESIDFNGHTGPFIQYTHARIKSLLRKAGKATDGSDDGTSGDEKAPLLPEERAVIKLLHQYPAVLNESASRLDPSSLANHAYEVVKAYNGFYQAIPVMKEEDERKRERRLLMSAAVGRTTKKAMWCLGIEVPERM